jgi:nucleotidyltransferase substrate binding protein (TIGR01987 family)
VASSTTKVRPSTQSVIELVLDAAIQRVEFAFGLLWKSLNAYAEQERVEVYSPNDRIRSAFRLGVIPEDWDWFQRLEDRHLTSDTNSEAPGGSQSSRLPPMWHASGKRRTSRTQMLPAFPV